jgi:thiol-disulfide isomerase/thioredoxin
MTLIADKDRPTVRDVLARELVSDVELVLFVRGRAPLLEDGQSAGLTCYETRELLGELVQLSERIHLTVHDVSIDPATATRYNVNAVPTVIVRKHASSTHSSTAVDALSPENERPVAAVPSAAVAGISTLAPETDANVRFVGLPGGYEFSTLIADIVDVSKGRTGLAAATIDAVQAIKTPVHLRVFVTPNCPYCPRAARIAHQLAMANPLVLAEVIEANEFEALSERYRVQTVPKTVINDEIEFVGPRSEAMVLAAVLEAVSRRTAQPATR